MLISGRCHCGNISFTLNWEPEPLEIPVRDCDCSFCTKHGGVWTSCPMGSLEIVVRQRSQLTPYTFGTGTAQFHVCSNCGVVPVATSRIGDRLYAVVNASTFEGVDPSLLKRAPSSFDEESEEARLARRRRNWIANVKYV